MSVLFPPPTHKISSFTDSGNALYTSNIHNISHIPTKLWNIIWENPPPPSTPLATVHPEEGYWFFCRPLCARCVCHLERRSHSSSFPPVCKIASVLSTHNFCSCAPFDKTPYLALRRRTSARTSPENHDALHNRRNNSWVPLVTNYTRVA